MILMIALQYLRHIIHSFSNTDCHITYLAHLKLVFVSYIHSATQIVTYLT